MILNLNFLKFLIQFHPKINKIILKYNKNIKYISILIIRIILLISRIYIM